jgi:hypothetical protein
VGSFFSTIDCHQRKEAKITYSFFCFGLPRFREKADAVIAGNRIGIQKPWGNLNHVTNNLFAFSVSPPAHQFVSYEENEVLWKQPQRP